jgi:hypothetical protein
MLTFSDELSPSSGVSAERTVDCLPLLLRSHYYTQLQACSGCNAHVLPERALCNVLLEYQTVHIISAAQHLAGQHKCIISVSY